MRHGMKARRDLVARVDGAGVLPTVRDLRSTTARSQRPGAAHGTGAGCAIARAVAAGVALTVCVACAPPEPEGLRRSDPSTGAEVRFDIFARPLPDIPLPNDIATRFDPASPTKRRINASMVASSTWETRIREQLDQLDGWGTFAPISVSFSKPLDVEVIYDRHRDDYDFRNDAVYVIDVTPDSPDFCQPMPLDMGEGNFPYTLERTAYYPNDIHDSSNTLVFEELEEDANGNGRLDPGEDLDMDGVLDHPNTRHPDGDPVNDLMTFYERETNTLILRPLMPLREETTYAVVLTRRLLDESGRPVRSPFDYINHTAQTQQLEPLPGCLGALGLRLDDVAFTWAFTTQSITRDFRAIRDGLYGLGSMGWLADSYPVKLDRLFKLHDDPGAPNPYIVPGDQFLDAAADLIAAVGGGADDPTVKAVIDSHRFIGFHAVGQFTSPQFFPRTDADGKPLPLSDQVWNVNPATGEAFHRGETVTFWLTVPRKELAQRPTPVVILGHGYTGNKLDPLMYGGFFARHGVATIGMEDVSHGIGLDDADVQIARALFQQKGLTALMDALLHDRAFDQNGDGISDSGADFWTAYTFHTRDVVRQSAVDYMTLIRLLKSFDGTRTWDWDVNGDGKKDKAGDFDGDGEVDIGGTGLISISGGSLGGIMSVVLGGTEPQIDVAVPVSGGAGLTDIGLRSIQGGVAEAVNLRMMGPLLLDLRNADTGAMELWEYLPDLNDVGRVNLGEIDVSSMKEGDTVVVINQRSGEWRCGRVQADALFRVAVSSDDPDPLTLEFYKGPLPPQAQTGCYVPDRATPYLTVDTLGRDAAFQGKTYAKGSPLVAFGDGFGLRRNSPETRRFMTIAQTILDPGDPANFAPFFENRLLEYGTGEKVQTRALVLNTVGDMNVPMSTGAAIARAAGFIPFTERDPRWNKTPNQVLIDTGSLEATERTRRYVNSSGDAVLMDVEHLALVTGGDDGFDAPRLDRPLRLFGPSKRVGGITGTLFPYVNPHGRHGFDPPSPEPGETFDLGSLIMNMVGHYVNTKGRELAVLPCEVDSSCEWIPQLPDSP